MYELHKKISAIEVEGKTFKDICTKVPIVNIFHTEKRRRKRETKFVLRRNAILGRRRRETLVTEGQDPFDPDQDPSNATLQLINTNLTTSAPQTSNLNSTTENPTMPPASEDVDDVKVVDPVIPDAAYKELWPDYYEDYKEVKGVKQVKEDKQVKEAASDSVWPDYDYLDDEDYVAKPEVTTKKPERIRINYDHYGRQEKKEGEEKKVEVKELPADITCGIVTRLREKCLQSNLLEIWQYKEDLIYSTTQQEIIDAVNLLESSPWTAYPTDFSSQLGGIVRNSTGHVVSATAAQMYWNVAVPDTASLVRHQGSGVELELADAVTLAWEEQMIRITLNTTYPDHSILPHAAKSFGDVSSEAIFFDAVKMAVGYGLMFLYTIFMLGRVNSVEIKLYLSIAGITSVGMGLIIALGLSSMIGYAYTPMHAALPFLCLGKEKFYKRKRGFQLLTHKVSTIRVRSNHSPHPLPTPPSLVCLLDTSGNPVSRGLRV